MEGDFEIHHALVSEAGIVNAQAALVGANELAVGGHPFVAGTYQTEFLAGFHGIETVMHNHAASLGFGPKIRAVHLAMSKPQ